MESMDKLPLNATCQREYYPLTFNQLGIWLLYQTSPEDPVLNLASKTRFKGSLQIEKLAETLTLLIESNSTLRTRFIIINNEPYQVISRDIKPALTYIDLSNRLKFEREVDGRILTEREARQPFDLFKGPLVRFMLIRLEEDDHLFLFNLHHIISDGTTLNLIWEKLISLYNGLIKTGTANLTPMKVHYHDFAVWQHQAFKGDYFKHQEYFWLKEFSGKVPQVTSFPIDLKTQSSQNYNGRTCEKILDREFAASLKKFSFRHKVNLFSTLLAAFYILLHKFTGQDDLVIGAYFSARQNQPKLFSSIGWLINVLPLRIHIFPGQTVLSFIKSLKDKVFQVYLNQDYPLLKLIRKINPQRFSNRLPLFQVVFNMVPANLSNTPMAGVTAGDREFIETQTSQYDLTVLVFDRPPELMIKFEYSTNLYKRESIIKLMEHYRMILQKVLEDPEIAIGKLEILSRQEKQKLAAWLNNAVEYDKNKFIHILFEEKAGKTPDRTAVVYRENEWTYRRLNENANRLARFLRARGIHKDQLVGILLDRSPSMVESILATWKAGGAYIPIDTQYPGSRITGIFKDSAARVLLTKSQYVDAVMVEAYGSKILQLDKPGSEFERENPDDLDFEIDMNSLAYIIYTSGSTGKPKGVMVEHIGMMNHIWAKIHDLQLTEKSIIAQNASHTFDISLWQFFAGLTLGGKTVIYPDRLILEPDRFTNQLIRNQVTILEVVPSYLSAMLDLAAAGRDPSLPLDYILVTGEEVKPHLVKRWFQKFPGIKMVNAYGPTEASDDITHYIMDKAPHMERIPIGKPLQNLNIYIVDKNMKLCPLGVKGELCVSGVGVGRGYLNDKERTRQVFMEDPFIGKPGVRLYKTGDLGRWLPGGSIEFLGRIDNQVKIRGFRIELEEIEKNLLGSSLVKEAAVGIEEDTQKGPRLTAYLVLKPGKTPTKNELIDGLKTKLPEYMIPTDFVILDRLYYTSNGKLDRKALSAQQHKKLEIRDNFTPPGSPIEEGVVKIWAEALGIERVGTRDNFFYLGGHSLLASKIILQVREIFGVDISLLTLFSTPTVEGMSRKINQLLDKN